ncbi:MAG: alpha-L-fucosidase [Acidobacteriaceae bacterium]
MLRSALYAPLMLALAALLPPRCLGQNVTDIKPSPQQVVWQDLEIGAIIHFGTNTFLDREWGDGTAPPSVFNPADVDTGQWMDAAKSAGIRYVVMVAKHHDGFALWPSGETGYSVKSSPWLHGKGDLVRMAADSARSHGLAFGVYLSPWDRHDPRYPDPAAYDKYYLAQLDELASGYGPLEEFWLDGAGSANRTYDFDTIVDHLRVYQPDTQVFADVALFKFADLRWVGNESGKVTFENWNVVDRSGYLRWRPVEADTPLHREHWFWHPNDEASLKSVDELMDIYNNSVGRGAQLMLGLAPDRTGRLPAADVARLQEFGARVSAVYGNNLALRHQALTKDAEAALDGKPETYWPVAAGTADAVLEVRLPSPLTIDRALTMERLNDGQHIEEYSIEVFEKGGWREVAHAGAIGHKKIDIFPPVTVDRVRLRLLAVSGAAGIREFQLYNGSAAH